MPPTVKKTPRFRIGISYSRHIEDRVQPVAEQLAMVIGSEFILYDKFHEAEFARGDLAFYLPKLYYEECELIVAIFDESYLTKEWTGLEWNAIHALHKSKQFKKVMLLCTGKERPDSLFDLDGASDISNKEPVAVASLILERLAINEGRPKNYYISELTGASVPGGQSSPDA